MHTQLGEWTKLGFFTRAGHGTYALNTPGQPSSTTATDLNFVALLRVRLRRPLMTESVCRMVRQLSGSGEGLGQD